MKTARTVKGESIPASATAPRQAICLRCGGVVTLRHRQRMNNDGVAYFWRHRSNSNLHCQSRARPIG